MKELGKEYIEPDEPAVIAEMVKEMEAQVDRVYKDRKMLRQVHTKSHGCVKGIFEVPELENDLKVGVFEHSRKFHAWIRFSNSNSTPKPDKVKDIRGIAIKLLGVDGEKILEDEKDFKTQDFLLMSSEVFFSHNLMDFRKTLKAATNKNKLVLVLYFLNPLNWKLLSRFIKTQIHCSNPLDQCYWSTQPFRFGAPDKAVKYFIKPHESNTYINEDFTEDNFLQINMAQTLNSHEAKFDFFVQFQTNAETMPIEDPTIPWKSPFRKVATLTIVPQSFTSEAELNYGENLSFNPWHSLPEHRPLGSFNRARKVAYETLSKYRHKWNNAPLIEPEDSPDFLQSTNYQS